MPNRSKVFLILSGTSFQLFLHLSNLFDSLSRESLLGLEHVLFWILEIVLSVVQVQNTLVSHLHNPSFMTYVIHDSLVHICIYRFRPVVALSSSAGQNRRRDSVSSQI